MKDGEVIKSNWFTHFAQNKNNKWKKYFSIVNLEKFLCLQLRSYLVTTWRWVKSNTWNPKKIFINEWMRNAADTFDMLQTGKEMGLISAKGKFLSSNCFCYSMGLVCMSCWGWNNVAYDNARNRPLKIEKWFVVSVIFTAQRDDDVNMCLSLKFLNLWVDSYNQYFSARRRDWNKFMISHDGVMSVPEILIYFDSFIA